MNYLQVINLIQFRITLYNKHVKPEKFRCVNELGTINLAKSKHNEINNQSISVHVDCGFNISM
jgi:hypothetical protein